MLRREDAREALLNGIRGVERLVLLGDVVELGTVRSPRRSSSRCRCSASSPAPPASSCSSRGTTTTAW